MISLKISLKWNWIICGWTEKGFVDSMSNKNEFGNDIVSLKVIIINGKGKDVKWMSCWYIFKMLIWILCLIRMMDAFDCISFPWNLSASLLVCLTVFKFVPIIEIRTENIHLLLFYQKQNIWHIRFHGFWQFHFEATTIFFYFFTVQHYFEIIDIVVA